MVSFIPSFFTFLKKGLGKEKMYKTKKSHSLGFVENLSQKGADCAE